MASYTPHPRGVATIITAPGGALHSDMTRRILRVEAHAKQLCPVKSSRLRSSIRHAVIAEATRVIGICGSDVLYAGWVHEGLDEEWLEPTQKQALYWRGAPHPVARVHRSEKQREGQPFLRLALPAAGDHHAA